MGAEESLEQWEWAQQLLGLHRHGEGSGRSSLISSQVNCLRAGDEAQLPALSFELSSFLMAWKAAQALAKTPLQGTASRVNK